MVYAHEPNFNLADMEFITKVTAKSKEFFYQYAKPKQTLRFECQTSDSQPNQHKDWKTVLVSYRGLVVDSGFSKLDISRDMTISFYVRSPDNKIVVKDLKKSHAIKK
ncbi:GOLD domain-containing protein [Trichonephila clavipes]|nr:GOLD domain-containing protein [Trichonephila clavipes]